MSRQQKEFMMAGLWFPKPRREKLATVCVRLQRRRWYVSPVFLVFYELDLLPYFVRVLLRNRGLFTQRGLPALRLSNVYFRQRRCSGEVFSGACFQVEKNTLLLNHLS